MIKRERERESKVAQIVPKTTAPRCLTRLPSSNLPSLLDYSTIFLTDFLLARGVVAAAAVVVGLGNNATNTLQKKEGEIFEF